MVHSARVRQLKPGTPSPGKVIACWLSEDQRARDNWALILAQEMAQWYHAPLAVCFCLAPGFLGATRQAYSFMLSGLRELERDLASLGISFYLLIGLPEEELPRFVRQFDIGALVSDSSALRIKREWKARAAAQLNIPFYEVDAHHIVPLWLASDHAEFAARTLRPKMLRLLPEFLSDLPPLHQQAALWPHEAPVNDWEALPQRFGADRVAAAQLPAGEGAALRALRGFIADRLAAYPADSNDANSAGQSGLSPYLHFGQLSAQRVAWEVRRSEAPQEAKDVFLEQLIVRRELAANFCYYTPAYDRFEGFPAWARRTLDRHRSDPRLYLYTRGEFEAAETHDRLWNAAQRQLLQNGVMHGYVRMYWAKKLLEWSASPEEALETGIYLNDRYELDGRDPNGCVGVAWSVGGVHDRPWAQRPVFGQIRYMTENACRRKFDVQEYIRRFAR